MGARFYAPKLGIWTSADPAILVKPEQYVTAEFAAANPYAYANLRPVVAADRDGQFWHIVAGAVAGGLIGGGMELAQQYLQHGKIESWGRVAAATGGGIAGGSLTMANPAAGLASVMGMGATSNVVGGITTRLVASGGKSGGTLTDVATDAAVGAGTAGIVKGGSSVLRKVLAKKVVSPAVSTGAVGKVGTSSVTTGVEYPVKVLGRQADTAVAQNWAGHEVLNIASWTLKKNDAWVASGISAGQNFYLASPKAGNLIQASGSFKGQPTVFARELGQLAAAGYKQVDDYMVHPSNLGRFGP